MSERYCDGNCRECPFGGRWVARNDEEWQTQRRRVFRLDERHCVQCGRRIWTLADMDCDHRHGRGMGGGFRCDRDQNLQTMCRRCHRVEKHGC
jgi:5-methylcytosine-specific restriction endonuclease McrA